MPNGIVLNRRAVGYSIVSRRQGWTERATAKAIAMVRPTVVSDGGAGAKQAVESFRLLVLPRAIAWCG